MPFDPDTALRELHARGAPLLAIERHLAGSGGLVGSWLLRDAAGGRHVLSFRGGPGALETHERSLSVLERLWDVGYPAPRYEWTVETSGGVAVVQEFAEGRTPTVLTHGLLDQLLALVERQRGLFNRPGATPLYLLEDGPGYCIHASLAGDGDGTRGVLRWVEDVGRTLGTELVGQDAVHNDLHPGNLLVDEASRINAVVDWDGAHVGDASLDLVVLAFGAAPIECEPGVRRRIARAVRALPPDTRRLAWAHMSLRLVDWAIRVQPGAVDDLVQVARSGMD